jgi:competence ComEA-like helix-hairpin-helix protein
VDPEALSFRIPRPTKGPRHEITLALFVALGVLWLMWRPIWEPRVDDGLLVEVSGNVPHPGMYVVYEATIAKAIEAAGGDGSVASPAPLHGGEHVKVDEHGQGTVVLPSKPLLVALPVDVNAAPATAISAIPGVGDKLAEAVVADREKRGPYYAVTDLSRVRGVGPSTLEELKPFVTVGEIGPRPAWKPMNVNHASAAALQRLPGIGPVTAERIVADRKAHGPFATVDELQRVRGMGPSTVAAIAELVTAP